jgi:lycopene cyclase domain-containing protein
MTAIQSGNKGWFVKVGLMVLSMGMIGYLFITAHELEAINLEVNAIGKIGFLESKWTYFYLHLITIGPVFALSFDRKVAFYKSWRHLWPPILLVGAGFITWDVFFTFYGVWGFNPKYLAGIHFLRLPIEEWMFFVSVPFACVFIYECLNAYFPEDSLDRVETWITNFLILVFGLTALFYYTKPYTFLTFGLSSVFLILHRRHGTKFVRKRFYLSYIVVLIPFLLVNGVLTGAFTEEPIVAYSEQAFMGKRIFTIPVEDSIYGFLLLMSIITGFEKLKQNERRRNK